MFLSIFIATCRPDNITGFLDNLKETAEDPSSFEVLIKLDEGASTLVRIIEKYKKTSTFTIKYIASPKLDGYYTLDVGYNELLTLADPDTYFCWLLTDEIRLKTKGWDSILKKYVGFYPDDIFRIKLSIFQSKNYLDFFECLPCPDNYAVTTRKWLEITGGWGNFWGPDSWHQCIDFYLGLCTNKSNPFGIWRSFPIFDIVVAGQEAGMGIENPDAVYERTIRIAKGWKKHSTRGAQENFLKLAQRLNCHIYAVENNIQKYIIKEYPSKKIIKLHNIDNDKPVLELRYRVPRFRIKLLVGYKSLAVKRFLYPYYAFLSRILGIGHLIKLTFRIKHKLENAFYSVLARLNEKLLKEKTTSYFYDGKHLQEIERETA